MRAEEFGNTAEPLSDREIIITRDFDAPARLLFEAYSKPEHLMRWFGPAGWPVTKCEVDFRVGGKYTMQMTGPGNEAGPPFGGEYLEIVPNKKIVYDDAFLSPGSEKLLFTITFDEKGGKTTLRIHAVFETVEAKNKYVEMGIVEGIYSGLDQLVDLVAEMQGVARA